MPTSSHWRRSSRTFGLLAVDYLVVGGDVLPGPMPAETLACLSDLDLPAAFIHGNGDRIVHAQMTGGDISEVPEQHREVIRWTAAQLRSRTRDVAGELASHARGSRFRGWVRCCSATRLPEMTVKSSPASHLRTGSCRSSPGSTCRWSSAATPTCSSTERSEACESSTPGVWACRFPSHRVPIGFSSDQESSCGVPPTISRRRRSGFATRTIPSLKSFPCAMSSTRRRRLKHLELFAHAELR